MKYDFTSIIDRRGRDAIAVDGLKGDGFSPAPPKEGFDVIPMWVADMNFPTVPTIQDGRMFHGPCHLRMNLASPRSRIEEAFRRMDRYVFNA